MGGVAQISGEWFSVPVGKLGDVQYVGDLKAGGEVVVVAVFDQTTNAWSAYSSLTATSEAAPIAQFGLWLQQGRELGTRRIRRSREDLAGGRCILAASRQRRQHAMSQVANEGIVEV